MIKETVLARKPLDPKDFLSLDFVINDAVTTRMHKALKVINESVNISSLLSNLDPQALKQVQDAIEEYESSYQQCNVY